MTINDIIKRMRRMSRVEQIHFLRAELRKEPERSIRRMELEAMLKPRVTRQVRSETAA